MVPHKPAIIDRKIQDFTIIVDDSAPIVLPRGKERKSVRIDFMEAPLLLARP